MAALAHVGLGSNLGDRQALLQSALAALDETPGLRVVAASRLRETLPAGGPSGQPPYLNAAAALESSLSPQALLRRLLDIEAQHGRTRTIRWGERTLDLDLLLYDDTVLDTPELTLPHPRMALRRFVLAPLHEIAPEVLEPMTGQSITRLLANVDRRPSYVALQGSTDALRHSVYQMVAQTLHAMTGPAPSVPDPKTAPQSLQPSRIQDEEWKDRWLVTASYPVATLPAEQGKTPAPESFQTPADPESRLVASWREPVSPTFVAILPGGTSDRTDVPLDCPTLRLQPGDTGSIAREILAACAATRSG